MKIVRNDPYIEKRSKIGRYVSLAGLIVLLAGMVLSIFRQDLIAISFGCLLVGMVCSQIGIYYGNRFVRPDRPEEALNKALKGLDDHYTLCHYMLPIPHALLGPEGLYVMNVQPQSGKITGRGSKWKQSMGWKWIFAWMGQEGMGNPARVAQMDAEKLERYLKRKMPGVEVPLIPIVVFSSPEAELDVEDPEVPVVHVKKLKEWLRVEGKGKKLSSETRTELLNLLGNDKRPSTASA